MRAPSELIVAAALVVAATVAAGLLHPDVHHVLALRQVALATATLVFTVALVFSLGRGARFELRTHWGGLGGGLGGWRLSAPVVYLIGALAFGALTASLAPPPAVTSAAPPTAAPTGPVGPAASGSTASPTAGHAH